MNVYSKWKANKKCELALLASTIRFETKGTHWHKSRIRTKFRNIISVTKAIESVSCICIVEGSITQILNCRCVTVGVKALKCFRFVISLPERNVLGWSPWIAGVNVGVRRCIGLVNSNYDIEATIRAWN